MSYQKVVQILVRFLSLFTNTLLTNLIKSRMLDNKHGGLK